MTLQSTTIFTEAEVPAKGKRSRKKRLLEHKRSFVFHYDEMNVVMELDDEDAGKFLKSIIAHAVLETGMTARKDIPLTDKQLRSLIKAANANGVLYVLYRQFITLFRIDNERYQRRVKSCSENGKKGVRPSATPTRQEPRRRLPWIHPPCRTTFSICPTWTWKCPTWI